MDTPTDPHERAKTYERYRKAHLEVKKLKPLVDAMAAEDLQAGVKVSQLAERSGMGKEVFRRMARRLGLPVDERYEERAARQRRPADE